MTTPNDLPAPVNHEDGQAPPASEAPIHELVADTSDVNSVTPGEGGAPAPLALLRLALADLPDLIDQLEEEGDWESLAYGLDGLRKLHRDLGFIRDMAEQALTRVLPKSKVEVEGFGTIQRRRSTKRTKWQHSDLLAEVLKSGIYGPSLLEVFTPSWKVTGLRELGLDPSEWCQEDEGVQTIQIHGGEK